jgi:hypothetical protein
MKWSPDIQKRRLYLKPGAVFNAKTPPVFLVVR